MKSITGTLCASVISLRRLQNALELAAVLAPATMRIPWSADDALFLRPSGTSPRSMRLARPSRSTVLPTAGSPIRTGWSW